jgi:hypothetical protein
MSQTAIHPAYRHLHSEPVDSMQGLGVELGLRTFFCVLISSYATCFYIHRTVPQGQFAFIRRVSRVTHVEDLAGSAERRTMRADDVPEDAPNCGVAYFTYQRFPPLKKSEGVR